MSGYTTHAEKATFGAIITSPYTAAKCKEACLVDPLCGGFTFEDLDYSPAGLMLWEIKCLFIRTCAFKEAPVYYIQKMRHFRFVQLMKAVSSMAVVLNLLATMFVVMIAKNQVRNSMLGAPSWCG